MEKRWLVSVDFGHTEPEGLDYLASLGNSRVRVPNAIEVIANNLELVCPPKRTIVNHCAEVGRWPSSRDLRSGEAATPLEGAGPSRRSSRRVGEPP
jgi:hypothetical protein